MLKTQLFLARSRQGRSAIWEKLPQPRRPASQAGGGSEEPSEFRELLEARGEEKKRRKREREREREEGRFALADALCRCWSGRWTCSAKSSSSAAPRHQEIAERL